MDSAFVSLLGQPSAESQHVLKRILNAHNNARANFLLVNACRRHFNHRRSEDFLWGALFPHKVDDLFSRRQYTD